MPSPGEQLLEVVRTVYDKLLRNHLPRKIGIYNGVIVRAPALFDAVDVRPDAKLASHGLLREHVEIGDHVVVIGGGYGASSATAALAAEDVTVTVYEAGQEQVDLVRETVGLNAEHVLAPDDLEDRVTVKHALVGDAVDVYGNSKGSKTVAPSDLPGCDVMLLDCEGAETSIVPDLGPRPRLLLVEAHPEKGSPPDAVHESLKQIDFEVVNRESQSRGGGSEMLVARPKPDGNS